MADLLHVPTSVNVIDPTTGTVHKDWQRFFRQLNTILAGLTFSTISGTISLAQLVDHAATHASGGGDDVKLDDLATPDDNTDLNASTTRHGLLRKLEGTGTKFLRDDGVWA